MDNQSIANAGGVQFALQDQPAKQIVYLDFDGELTSYNGEILVVENVEVQDSSLTNERIADITATLNRKYNAQNIVFVTERPQTGKYSTVYIGKTSAFDPYGNFTGLAETIDHGNKISNDNAFVMLDSTANNETIIAAIAHETDHLLGTLDHGGEGLAAYAVQITVEPGTVSSGLTISSGDTLSVSSGAITADTYVSAGGAMILNSGAKAAHKT